MSGWAQLTPKQQAAAKVAARVIEDEGLQYLILLFGADKRGAIIGNIEPSQAVSLIEAAHAAAKAMVAAGTEGEEIDKGTLQ
jgi:acyl-CoA synthetase (AMP-forming)/AMP-acid ligase II